MAKVVVMLHKAEDLLLFVVSIDPFTHVVLLEPGPLSW